jgi:hypothetical protein
MNELKPLLAQAAEEIRAYENRDFCVGDAKGWLARIADDMHQASLLVEKEEIERAILSLSHRIIDSGPLTTDFCPSFLIALGAVQRSLKAKNKTRRRNETG